MKIKSLHVKNFGKINNARFSFKEGINLISGENESGKTTLHTFIHSMFYGIRRLRGRAAANDRYSRCRPWINSSFYAGTMTFESGGKIFRLDRDFLKGQEKAELVCESDGEKLSIEQGDLKMLLGNVSEAVFDNTVSVGQMKVKTDESLLSALRSYMAVYGESQAAGIDVDEALYRLRLTGKNLEKQIRAEQEKIQDKMKKLKDREDYIEQECEDLAQKAEDGGKQKSNEAGFKLKRRVAVSGAAAVLAGLLGISGGFPAAVYPVFFLCALFAAGICGFWIWKLGKKKAGERKRKQRQRWEKEQRQQILEEKNRELFNLKNEIAELKERLETPHPLKEECQALLLAEEAIRSLSAKKQSLLGGALQKKMSVILSQITEGKYTGIHISENFEIGIDAKDAYVNPDRLSRGTVEQIYFAFRMAAGELLCQEESLPFLLDDVFAMYDERRLENVLRWLAQCGHQILIFTCHRREKMLLEKLGIPYHEVKLEDQVCL